jgi:hypothetical protein
MRLEMLVSTSNRLMDQIRKDNKLYETVTPEHHLRRSLRCLPDASFRPSHWHRYRVR